MSYPEFYNKVPELELYDPLADFLGASEKGIMHYSYLDCVKTAGHSCPTIAGAYLLVSKALSTLYPDSTPVRGGIRIEFRDALKDGVVGVISNLMTQVTGATKESGFKGIAGNFVRHSLMDFEVEMKGMLRFTRLDNLASIELDYSPIPPNERQNILMQKRLSQSASEQDIQEFKEIWQERVRKTLLEHSDDPQVIVQI